MLLGPWGRGCCSVTVPGTFGGVSLSPGPGGSPAPCVSSEACVLRPPGSTRSCPGYGSCLRPCAQHGSWALSSGHPDGPRRVPLCPGCRPPMVSPAVSWLCARPRPTPGLRRAWPTPLTPSVGQAGVSALSWDTRVLCSGLAVCPCPGHVKGSPRPGLRLFTSPDPLSPPSSGGTLSWGPRPGTAGLPEGSSGP